MIKHLLYHCTPIGNWRWNLEQLKQRWHVFNGLKYIAVAQGEGIEDWYSIRSDLPAADEDTIVFPYPNDPDLRETATLLPMLQRLYEKVTGGEDRIFGRTFVGNDICFYGHTKGVTRQQPAVGREVRPGLSEAVRLWTEASYHWCLDEVDKVQAMFRHRVPAVGVFKRYGTVGSFPKFSHWHYSGTFYWFRVEEMFCRRDLDRIILPHRYGAEAFPSAMWPDVMQCGCVFGDGIGDMYDMRYVRKILQIPDGAPPVSTKSRYVKKVK